MTLPIGSRFGSYIIDSFIDRGGMGEVYRAHHFRLPRSVALKVLPAEFASDIEMIERMRREAEMLVLLDHQNIAALFDVEEENGTVALALEFIEGPTLADRLDIGPLPWPEVLPIAEQILDALEATHLHELKIIHRDLKPGNIKVSDDGLVKVLDFGLAKAHEPPKASSASSALTPALRTVSGILLGTPEYMSPEQATAATTDQRTDIWAFGCVLYEMLTGEPPFGTGTVTDVVARVLAREPDWNKLPHDTPASLRRALRRCLAKPLHERYADVRDVRLDLRDASREDAIDVDTVHRVFSYTGDHARIHEALACLKIAHSAEDALDALDSLCKELSSGVPRAKDLLDAVLAELRSFPESGLLRLTTAEPGNPKLVQERLVSACVKLIEQWPPGADCSPLADTYCTWLGYGNPRDKLRNEAVRELSHRLITQTDEIVRKKVLAAYELMIDRVDLRTDSDLLHGLVLIPFSLTRFDANVLARLFIKTFHRVVVPHWARFHSVWIMTVSEVANRCSQLDRSYIHRELSEHVQQLKKALPARTDEYRMLVDVMARVRHKPCRPMNCFTPAVDIHAMLACGDDAWATVVPCIVGNLRLPADGGSPGAWMTSAQATSGRGRRRARLILILPGDERLTLEGHVDGPETEEPINNSHGHTFGYRFQFDEAPSGTLERIPQAGPLT